MSRLYGGQNMYAPLKRVLVRRPDESFAVEDPALWHYTSAPDLPEAQAEHDALAMLLRDVGAEVIYHDIPLPEHADSIFVFDPVLITDAGAVILSMGKSLRQGEEDAMQAKLNALGIPTLHRLSGNARAEGGDLLWLDENTLAAGVGFRTNKEGIKQLQDALAPLGVSVSAYDLPYFLGPDACLHLLSLISIVDERKAVIYPELMPVPFWQELQSRGFDLLEVPEQEFMTMGPNVLALAPGICLMLEGNPRTAELLLRSGCEIITYKGDELSLKAEGGPTCLTRPILRV